MCKAENVPKKQTLQCTHNDDLVSTTENLNDQIRDTLYLKSCVIKLIKANEMKDEQEANKIRTLMRLQNGSCTYFLTECFPKAVCIYNNYSAKNQ